MLILIHGTFARDAGWTQPGSSMRTRIERDAPGAVTFYPFQWSGKNTHRARTQAGRQLATRLRDIKARHPQARTVAIGHSHGGNLVLYAARHLEIDRCLDGVASLGTPFIHVDPRDITEYTRTLDFCLHTIRFVLWLLAFTLNLYVLSAYTFERPIDLMPAWLAAEWSPASIAPAWRWFVFAPLLVLFALHYLLLGMFHFLLLLHRADYAMHLPSDWPGMFGGRRDAPGSGNLFEHKLLPRLKRLQASVMAELMPPATAFGSFLAVVVHQDEAGMALRHLDGVANLAFKVSDVTGLPLRGGAMLLVYPFFAMFPAGFLLVPFLTWDSETGRVFLYVLGWQCSLVLAFVLLPIALVTLPHVRKLGFFGERIADYLLTHIAVHERPQTSAICLASYRLSDATPASTRRSLLKHSSICDDPGILDDLAQWLWHGHDPEHCSSFVRDRRYRRQLASG